MKKLMYKELKKKESVANTILNLVKHSKGCLSKEQIEKIANFEASLEFRDNNEQGNVTWINNFSIGDLNPYIKYTENSKEFANYINDSLSGLEHSWAGEEIKNTKVNVIIGNCIKGRIVDLDYSDNGNIRNEICIREEGDFNIKDVIVLYRWTRDFSNFNNDYYDEIIHEIVIYNGNNNSYKVGPEIQYILDSFYID